VSHQCVLLVVSHVDAKDAEAFAELDEINEFVSVLIKLAEQLNGVGLQVAVFASSFNLVNDAFVGGLWEHLTIVLHVLLGVLIAAHQHELEASEVDSAADNKVSLGVVLAANWVNLLLALHEWTANSAGVLVANLIHQDSVITAVERHDEGAGLIIRLGGDELGVEAHDVHVLFEHLLHVEFWWLGLEGNN